jgi:hypothetical protein
VNCPEAVVIVFDRALGESVKTGDIPGRGIVEVKRSADIASFGACARFAVLSL